MKLRCDTLYAFSSPSVFATCPSQFQPPWFYLLNYTWWGVQIKKLLIMQFSPFPSRILSKPLYDIPSAPYSPTLRGYVLPWLWRATFTPTHSREYLVLYHVQKIVDSKQRTDIRKYFFINRTIKNWNHLPAGALGTFPFKPKIFRNRARKAIINGVKWKE